MHISIIKSIVVMLTVLEIWLLLQVPAIGNAVFSFVVGGEVPGTDKILSMRQMVLLLTGMFILAVGVLFNREINRALNRIGRRPRTVVQISTVVASPPVSNRRIVWPTPPRFQPMLRHAAGGAQTTARRFAAAARIASQHGQKAVMWVCVMGVHLLYRLYVVLRTCVIRLWRWSRPYIEQCDRWIARKLHQNDITAGLLDIGSDLAAGIREWVGHLRSTR